jgi:dTDP-4-dehydrorhamnose 3,5-epimerase
MRQLETRLDGPILIAPAVHGDARGFFSETFRQNAFEDLGIHETMVQDNHSRSTRGVVRGIHFQIGEGASKLVRCGRGHIWDVVVDLREGSPTYAEWEGFNLTDENMHVLYVPIGFGHGFVVLSDVADVIYKQSNYYSPDVERGIRYDDPEIGIDWPGAVDLQVSDRDATAPLLRDVAPQLPFAYAAAN